MVYYPAQLPYWTGKLPKDDRGGKVREHLQLSFLKTAVKNKLRHLMTAVTRYAYH